MTLKIFNVLLLEKCVECIAIVYMPMGMLKFALLKLAQVQACDEYLDMASNYATVLLAC